MDSQILNERIPEAILIFHKSTGITIDKIKDIVIQVEKRGFMSAEDWYRLSEFGIKMNTTFERNKMMDGSISSDEFKYKLIELAGKTANNLV